MEHRSESRDRVREIWEKRLREWRASELSQAEYCRQKGLRIKSFAYWKRKEKPEQKEVRFVGLSLPTPVRVQDESPVRVILKSGYVIEIKDGFAPSTLRDVVRVLEVA